MNQRMTLLRFQKLRDIGRTDLQLQRAGYPVKRLDALPRHVLPVLVQINEPRSDHQPARVNDAPSAQRLR